MITFCANVVKRRVVVKLINYLLFKKKYCRIEFMLDCVVLFPVIVRVRVTFSVSREPAREKNLSPSHVPSHRTVSHGRYECHQTRLQRIMSRMLFSVQRR